jgi:2-haloacid dehalogenase
MTRQSASSTGCERKPLRKGKLMDLTKFKALTFDCYGTLIDWERGMIDCVRPWLTEMHSNVTPELVLTSYAFMKWRHEQPRPAMLFTELMRRCWIDLEGTFGFPADPERAKRFAASIGDWPPFEDSVAALDYFSNHYKLAILSNIDNVSIAKSKQLLGDPFAVTVSAEDVGSYKPGFAHFDEAFRQLRALGIRKHETLHVAQSKYHDISPANALGLASVWVNRRHGKPGTGATIAAEATPDLTVTSLAELVAWHRSRRPAPVTA